MSDPIQSISQSNYILHNIDAKKLYVQEPLFTANSGDAVYVGWRPDETVLFENSAGHTGNFTATEPLSAFNEVAVYVSPDINSEGPSKVVIPMMGRNISNFKFGWIGTFNGWKNIEWQFVYNNTAMTSFMPVSGAYFGKNTSNQITGGDWNANSMYMYKVVGINRKENA
jgi:hypothetical protein